MLSISFRETCNQLQNGCISSVDGNDLKNYHSSNPHPERGQLSVNVWSIRGVTAWPWTSRHPMRNWSTDGLSLPESHDTLTARKPTMKGDSLRVTSGNRSSALHSKTLPRNNHQSVHHSRDFALS